MSQTTFHTSYYAEAHKSYKPCSLFVSYITSVPIRWCKNYFIFSSNNTNSRWIHFKKIKRIEFSHEDKELFGVPFDKSLHKIVWTLADLSPLFGNMKVGCGLVKNDPVEALLKCASKSSLSYRHPYLYLFISIIDIFWFIQTWIKK